MKYHIRLAKKDDIKNVIDLASEMAILSKSPFRTGTDNDTVAAYRRKDLQSLYSAINNPDFAVFIAESLEGDFLGHVLVMNNHQESSTGEMQGFVFDLSVKSQYQGLGIGRELMNSAEMFCQIGGMPNICLNVTASNEKAVNFYKAIGYSEERKQMIKNLKPGQDAGKNV